MNLLGNSPKVAKFLLFLLLLTGFAVRSSDNAFSAVNWGISEDKPLPADYDGDGKS